jgi:hypothetical protein
MVSEAGAGPAARSDADGAVAGPALADHDAAAVGRLRDFDARHGGDAVAVIEHLGRNGARMVVVAPNGEFGDAVVSSVPAAAQVCQRAGLPVREWDRELTALVTMTPADRRRMAGQGR